MFLFAKPPGGKSFTNSSVLCWLCSYQYEFEKKSCILVYNIYIFDSNISLTSLIIFKRGGGEGCVLGKLTFLEIYPQRTTNACQEIKFE